jgi:CubicO group peptidase (beta-lactamase class C family)
MHTRVLPTLLGLLLLCVTAAHSDEVSAPPEFAQVREFIQQGVRVGRSPSVAIAVVKDDRIIWAEGFGLADIEAQRAANADSIYLLASVSKPMTATGMMVLVDRGLIDLDKPANDYLPGSKLRAYRGSPDDMTLRRLANHTSGMPVHWSFFYDGVRPPPRDTSIQRYGFSYNPPGSRWEYCNLAFGVIDHIIALEGKSTYGKLMETSVYDPLGMTHTSDHVRAGLESHATAQYSFDAGGRTVRVAPYGFDHDGASANWSSANDLARFLRMHLNGGELEGTRVLTTASATAMQTLSSVRNPEQPDSGTGIAWFVGPYMGLPCFAHSGGMPGVSTRVRGFPEHRRGYVVLLNASASGFRGEIEKRLTRTLIPGAKKSAPLPQAPPASVEPDWKPFIGSWSGRFVHHHGDLSLRLEIVRKGMAKISFHGRQHLTVKNLTLRSGVLTGSVTTRLATQPSFHGLVDLQVRLRRTGDGLTGIGVAQAKDYFSLSHFIELTSVARPAAPVDGKSTGDGRE